MANHTLYTTPAFDENLRKYETEDEVHADVFNAVDEKLINNDYYLKENLDDVTKNSKEHRENNEIHVTKKQKEEWSAKAENTEVTKEKKGLMLPTDKTKLDGIAKNAEVNQNAFSHVKVGGTTVAANGKTATFELVAGTNIKLTADNATKKVTISGTEHKHEDADIKSLDASKLTGVIDIERLPKGALERCIVVANDAARFALTKTQAQTGDTVKVNSTNKMYFVVDDTKLNTEAGYEVYAAGNASTVPWAGIIEKPSEFQPSKHTHTKEEISNFPSSMPANGGNADTVNNHTVGKNVPANAVFTDTTYPYYNKSINSNFSTQFRTQTKGNTTEGNYISNVRAEVSNTNFAPQYGSGLAWGSFDTHGYLGVSYSGADAYIGGGNADKLNWVRRILTEGDSTPANGGNADTVDGKHDVDFVQYKGQNLSDEEFNNPNFPFAYEAIIANGTAIGLPAGYWHIKNLRHPHGNGFDTQLALPLDHDHVMRYRRAKNMSWGEWVVLATKNQLDDCFRSVSDGKTLVANAITDKGVSTAANAEFATMANNIRNIQTGVDTSDATMTASDLLSGKTGYVNGNKITGSMVNRGGILRTLNCGESYIIPKGYHDGLGSVKANSLTSQTAATASSSDITSGETAWVNGRKITGTGKVKKISKADYKDSPTIGPNLAITFQDDSTYGKPIAVVATCNAGHISGFTATASASVTLCDTVNKDATDMHININTSMRTVNVSVYDGVFNWLNLSVDIYYLKN